MAIFRQSLSSEWRKQRWVLCAAAAIVLLCEVVFDIGWMAPKKAGIGKDFFAFAFLWLWLVVGSAAGSLAFAKGLNRSVDSDSQGSSFADVVLKLSIGVATAFLSGMIALIASLAFRGWAFNGYSSSSAWFIFGNLFWAMFPAGLLLAFACSILLATMSHRAFTSAISSVAITSLLFLSISTLWLRLEFPPGEKSIWIILCILAIALILVGISFWTSIRCSCGGRSIRGILPGVAIISLVTVLVCGCFVLIYLRTGIKDMQPIVISGRRLIKVSPTGKSILTTVISQEGMQIQVWILPINPKQGKRVVRRNAYEAEFSPDGNWIIYLSQQNRIGLASDFVSLRACRSDGSDDRALVPYFADRRLDGTGEDWAGGAAAVSQDGARVALNYGPDLYIAGIDGRSVHKVRLSSELSQGWVIGFHPNGAEILIYSLDKGPIACNPLEAKCRVLSSRNLSLRPQWSDRGKERFIPFSHQFFDLESATMRPFPDGQSCFDLNRDRQTLACVVNSDEYYKEKSTAQIHLYSIESGTDDLVATIPGWIGNMVFSPSGNSMAIALTGEKYQTAIMQSKKFVQSFYGWGIVGWAGESEVILVRRQNEYDPMVLAVGDIATGAVRRFYP
jgi:hypothetical protein